MTKKTKDYKQEYSPSQLSRMSGATIKALYFYEERGLISPRRNPDNGYRVYDISQVNRLQEILFFRELGVSVDDIKSILSSDNYNRRDVLESHLKKLKEEKLHIENLIKTIEMSISQEKGEIEMKNEEKFNGLKKKLIDENEEKYGNEIRKKYGDEKVDESNARLMGLSQTDYNRVKELEKEIADRLVEAAKIGDPSGDTAQILCLLHREWLSFFWNEYSKEAHMGLGEMYASDPRFRAYYDDIVPNGAEFLRDALKIFCSK